MRLEELDGVGPRLAERMCEKLGDEQTVIEALGCGDLQQFSVVSGLSKDRVLKLARTVRGDNTDFLATPEAEWLHEKLITQISEYSTNLSTHARLQLLTPIARGEGDNGNEEANTRLNDRRNEVTKVLDFARTAPNEFKQLRSLTQKLTPLQNPSIKQSRVVVTRDTLEHERLQNTLSGYRILLATPEESWQDYRTFTPLTWVGPNGPDSIPDGWKVVKIGADAGEVVPETLTEWLESNHNTLSILSQLHDTETYSHPFAQSISNALTGSEGVTELLEISTKEDDKAAKLNSILSGIWSEASDVERSVNDAIKTRSEGADTTFAGTEMLEYMADKSQMMRRLEDEVGEIISEEVAKGVEKLEEFLSPAKMPAEGMLILGWPCKVSPDEVARVEDEITKRIKSLDSDNHSKLAAKISPLKPSIEASVQALLTIDAQLTIAAWAIEVGACMPEIIPNKGGICVKRGSHLLLGFKADPVDYGIGEVADVLDNDTVALISGANSGGKTTLLEMLAQVTILAHSGLPVPASEAKVGHIERLHLLSKAAGTQSAGALERTIIRLANVVNSDMRQLVLADELEAITEPSAAARILAGMLEVASFRKVVTMVVVTHLAQWILDASAKGLRIDGIEAKGLDENFELIVDRTPRRDHLASSMPELILRRLVAKQAGNGSHDLLVGVLEKFANE